MSNHASRRPAQSLNIHEGIGDIVGDDMDLARSGANINHIAGLVRPSPWLTPNIAVKEAALDAGV